MSRRTVLATVPTVGAAALAVGGAPRPRGTDYLLVHGAWHGGAAWAEVLPELLRDDARAVAIDLPGGGPYARFPASYLTAGQAGLDTEVSPLRDLTVDDVADAVVAALRRLRGDGPGRRTVVVAHSLGGVAVTRAAEKAPELVDHLVYVAALVPTVLGSAAAAPQELGRIIRSA